MTDRAWFDDGAVASEPSLHLVVDLRNEQPSIHAESLPKLSADANLLSAGRILLIAKRAVDVIGSLFGLVVLSPLLLGIALAVTLNTPGPVFFKQQRVGRHGTKFDMYKFRSMVPNADELTAELLDDNDCSGPMFKMKQDPRITPVGRWLRRLSIDELPQLWNVFRGDMSLVGPRPELPWLVAQYDQSGRQRLAVRPGITCIWQVSGRSDLDFATWVSMDVQYIENWSLWLDLKLIARTIPAVLSGEGAY